MGEIAADAFRKIYSRDPNHPLLILFDAHLNIVDIVTADGSAPKKYQLQALNPNLVAQVSKFLD